MTYDQWKLATPPEYEGPTCPHCGGWLERALGRNNDELLICPECEEPYDEDSDPAADRGDWEFHKDHDQ